MLLSHLLLQFNDVAYLRAKNAVDAEALSSSVWQHLSQEVRTAATLR